jgi:hypothetical protein
MSIRRFAAIAAGSCALLTFACGGGSKPSTPTTPTTPTPAAVTVTALDVTGPGCAAGVCSGTVGGTIQLNASARMSDGTTQGVTAQAQWNSSNPSIAAVSSSGVVTFKSSGDSDVVAVYQGKSSGQTIRLQPAGPRTSFGSGQYLVGKDIAPGRYFSDPPSSGCYWERQKGLGGSLNDILANDFVGFNAGQLIVDVLPTDLAFKTDADCGTWFNSPRSGAQSTLVPGTWLVGSQISPGTYRTSALSGCYWERLRDFSGNIGAIIANDFVSSAGQQLVAISGSDVGFSTDDDCGSWGRSSAVTTLASGHSPFARQQSPSEIEQNRDRQRRQERGR